MHSSDSFISMILKEFSDCLYCAGHEDEKGSPYIPHYMLLCKNIVSVVTLERDKNVSLESDKEM